MKIFALSKVNSRRIISLIIALLFVYLSSTTTSVYENIKVNINLKTRDDFLLQIFYQSENNTGFNQENSVKVSVDGKGEYQNILQDLKYIKELRGLRLDFGSGVGQKIEIESLSVVGDRENKITTDVLLNSLIKDAELSRIDGDVVSLEVTGLDPYIILPKDLVRTKRNSKFLYLLVITFFIISYFSSMKLLHYMALKKKHLGWDKVVYLIIIFGIIITPALRIDSREIDERENRKLAIKPSLIENKHINLNYGNKLEDWFSDHFFLRKEVLNYAEKLTYFINQRVENEGAIEGREGWLFSKGNKWIENFQNPNKLSVEDPVKIEENLTDTEKWLEDKGIKYYTLIGPDKSTIYGDDFYPKKLKANINRTELLLNHLEKNTTLKMVYPREALLEEKEKGIGHLYYKGDTHWNEYGGFIGYIELMEAIKKDFPEVDSLTMDKIDFKLADSSLTTFGVEKKESKTTDLVRVLGEDNFKIDYSKEKYLRAYPRTGWNYKITPYKSWRDTAKTKTNKPLKVIIFRDSFVIAMLPYLAQTFGEVIFIGDYKIGNYKEYILQEKPDIVILETVERKLFRLLDSFKESKKKK